MLSDTEIKNQEVLVEDLKTQMPIWVPPDGPMLSGHIATVSQDSAFGACQNGIDFVPLDEHEVAWRKADIGEWRIASLDHLRDAVVRDIEEILDPVAAGYIATCRWYNRTGSGEWTEGIDFVALDESVIAWRSGGDFRDDGEWRIASLDHLRELVVVDAEEFLARWTEEFSEQQTTFEE